MLSHMPVHSLAAKGQRGPLSARGLHTAWARSHEQQSPYRASADWQPPIRQGWELRRVLANGCAAVTHGST
jgi:hypothetical protein